MQKRQARSGQMKNRSTRGDATLREFAKKDLGADIKAAGTAVAVRPQRPTSILIGDDLIAKLKEKAAKRGIPYQTMMKMIVREHIDDY